MNLSSVTRRGAVRNATDWLARHDPNYAALRRAGRTAIIAPALFAICFDVIGNAEIATYAAFGTIALLMLVDFSGPLRARLQGQAWLVVTGALLVCLGTLISQTLWLSVTVMAVVAFFILFFGVVSSVIAGSTTSLLLVFILSTAVAGPDASIPDRLAGWGFASFVSLFATWLLWPSHQRSPLRLSAASAARALAARLRADVAHWRGEETMSDATYEEVVAGAHRATESLHRGFLAVPSRPTGLSVSSRATVRLVDELLWLDALVEQTARPMAKAPAHRHDCEIRSASAAILETGADILEDPSRSPAALSSARDDLSTALRELERVATASAPVVASPDDSTPNRTASRRSENDERVRFVASLEPSFRAQEIGFVASLVGTNVDLVSAADRRGWLDTLAGLVPGDPSSRVSAARSRAAAHLNRHSVWLHNSLRGAVGLAIAVLVAEKTGVQHAFWVILGTLSVLRSNAVNTGANALRAVVGTAIGVALGAALLAVVGTNVTVLWFLLPVSILLAGFAPTAISFAAGPASPSPWSSCGISWRPLVGRWVSTALRTSPSASR